MRSTIMVMIPAPQPWEGIADLMILGMVTQTLPCRVFIFWGGVGGASSGHEIVSTKYVPSKGPFLRNSLLTFLFLKIMIIFVVDILANE